MNGPSIFDGPFLALPRWARKRIAQAQKGAALQVLCAILEHMNVRTKCANLSISDIATECALSKETVKRTLRWLVNEGMIEVERSTGEANTYRVVYREGGSPMTLGGVTHDPPVGSPMTLGGVTHDPSKVPKNTHLAGDSSIYNRIVLESSKRTTKEIVCDDPKGESMILGEDPEMTKAPVVKEPRKAYKEVDDLVRRFMYSKNFCMRTFTSKDVTILRRTCRLLLQSGLTVETVRNMIDSFTNDSRFFSYDNPVMAFASKKIQKLIMERVTVEVQDDDPVIMFMVNDFVRTDEELPWDTCHDLSLRKAVVARSLEALYRYPEVVASISKHWAGDFSNSEFLTALSNLESLVKSGMGVETVDVEALISSLSFVHLPQSLLSGKVRSTTGNLAEAAYVTRRANRV